MLIWRGQQPLPSLPLSTSPHNAQDTRWSTIQSSQRPSHVPPLFSSLVQHRSLVVVPVPDLTRPLANPTTAPLTTDSRPERLLLSDDIPTQRQKSTARLVIVAIFRDPSLFACGRYNDRPCMSTTRRRHARSWTPPRATIRRANDVCRRQHPKDQLATAMQTAMRAIILKTSSSLTASDHRTPNPNPNPRIQHHNPIHN